jgi:hypothetical protein
VYLWHFSISLNITPKGRQGFQVKVRIIHSQSHANSPTLAKIKNKRNCSSYVDVFAWLQPGTNKLGSLLLACYNNMNCTHIYIYIPTDMRAQTWYIILLLYIYYSTSRLHAICSMFDTPPPICTLFTAFGRHSLPFARYLHPHFTLHTPIPTSHYTYTCATQQSTFFTPHTLHSTLSAFHSLQCSGTVTGETCTRLFK